MKTFQSIDFFFFEFLLQSDNELLVSELQKKLAVADLISEIKSVENFPDFEKLTHVIQHGLQGFIAKNAYMSQWRQTILVILCRSWSIA